MRKIEKYFLHLAHCKNSLPFAFCLFSLIYCIIATLKRKFARFYDFGIPIISVGNLVLGGSGKSPFIIEIAKNYPNSCVICVDLGAKAKA